MKEQPVEFLECVELDLRDARSFYDSWLTGGELIFHRKFLETVSWIEWNPELFPLVFHHYRRAVIKRSYYGIFFVIEPEFTTVVGVFDLRQNPGSIRRALLHRKR